MLKNIKETFRNYKIEVVCIVLSLIGMTISVFKNDQSNFTFWMAYFVLCISDLGWVIHNRKLKELEKRIKELEDKSNN
jgi:hypothetical protein